jgi:hypothetical protein
VKSLKKELDERNEKYQCVKVLVDTLAKEGYGPFFEKEIEEDTKTKQTIKPKERARNQLPRHVEDSYET